MLLVPSRRFYWWSRQTARQCKLVRLWIFKNFAALLKYAVYMLLSCRVRSEDLVTVAQDLLVNLFAVLEMPSSKENEYVMKGNIFREDSILVFHSVRNVKNCPDFFLSNYAVIVHTSGSCYAIRGSVADAVNQHPSYGGTESEQAAFQPLPVWKHKLVSAECMQAKSSSSFRFWGRTVPNFSANFATRCGRYARVDYAN